MTTYRTYEAERNDGGGLDPIGGTDQVTIAAPTAAQAAQKRAAALRGIDDCHGTVIVATDDAGDSDEAIVNDERPADAIPSDMDGDGFTPRDVPA